MRCGQRANCPTGPTGSIGPTGPIGPSGNTLFAESTTPDATSTEAPTFTDVTGVSIVAPIGGFADIQATFNWLFTAAQGGGGAAFFRLAIDGVAIANTTGTIQPAGAEASLVETGAVQKRIAVTAGQVISLQWAGSNGATLQIVNNALQYANLLVRIEP